MKRHSEKTCRNCGNPLPGKTVVCPACGAKNRKPFYRQFWFIAVVLIAVLGVVFASCCGKKDEKFTWSDLVLADRLPEPASDVGYVSSDSEEWLSMYVAKIAETEYKAYVVACQEFGYTAEVETGDGEYTAYDAEGYKLELTYRESNEEMHIELSAPMELSALQWPAGELAGMLPVPASSIGSVDIDSSDMVRIYVGDMPKNAYSAYVDECYAAGFSVEYDRSDSLFTAKNAQGYKLLVRYEGNSVMSVELTRPDDAQSASTSAAAEPQPTEQPAASSDDSASSSDELRPEFKQAMDSFEQFFDEYIAFMERYKASEGTDLGLLADYASYMQKYSEMMEAMDAWDEQEMNQAELAYYIEVTSRISQKLLAVQ